MKQSIEREQKYLINQNTYEKAFKKAQDMSNQVEVLHQLNYYYDTPNQFWNEKDLTIRVRKINNKYLLQTKQQTQQKEVRLETEKKIEKLEKQMILTPGFASDINEQNKTVEIQGALLTKRTSFYCQNKMRLDFDINYYFGIQDYEIEIEYSGDIDEKVNAVALKLVGKDDERKVVGKRIRFYNAKNSVNF